MSSQPAGTTRALRQRTALVLLMAMFIVPLAAAWWLVGHWRPAPSAQHGELLNPAQPLFGFTFQSRDGGRDETVLHGHWTLLLLAPPGGCDALCQETLYYLRQIRVSLGKDMDRAQTALMLPAEPPGSLVQTLAVSYPQTVWGVIDPSARLLLLEPFGAGDSGFIYIIDPLGNLVMRYAPIAAGDVDGPRGVLADLRRLLKLSRVG